MKNSKKTKKSSATSRVYLIFIVGTALVLLISLAVSSIFEFSLMKSGLIDASKFDNSTWYWIPVFMLTSITVGIFLEYLLGKIIFKHIKAVEQGMTKLSEGNFSTRIDLGGYQGMKKLAESFNSLARELENTEILRSDFINEFSHEIKTPIVSISGLIPLMKSENLPVEKRNQYLSIMEEEVKRLSKMTSSILYLSKLETQTILTNKKLYNLSEQIRSCFLLLEHKWDKKGLTPCLDFDEYEVLANEDMLMQVWLNLLDNAIKFSECGCEISVFIEKQDGNICVFVQNSGPEIKEEDYDAIFGKFYQCDKSRSTDGNGIGLSIVKHIVTLHNGKISVKSENGKTTFTVVLPSE